MSRGIRDDLTWTCRYIDRRIKAIGYDKQLEPRQKLD